jgi:hypothetical protein
MKIKMLLRKKKKLSRRITTARVSGLAATRAVDRRLLETLFRRRHMPNNESAAPKSYDRAREMTEKALGVFVEGDEKTGAKLVEQAKGVDESAVRDVNEELEEDAASEHDPAKLSQSASK